MNPAHRGMHSPSSDLKPVLIVGGGLSGLAAAVEVASRHVPVILLEQKPKLGGRASSFVDVTTGEVVDNGQHVLIAGYERTMHFLDRIGTQHLLAIQEQPSFTLHHPTKGFCQFSIPRLPSPLHLLAGILSTDLFSFADRMRLLRAGVSLRFPPADIGMMTIESWLFSVGQSSETIRSFWEPLAISIMNEHVANASARVFVNSLRHAFLGGWRSAALAVPKVGLSELYVDGALTFLVQHGATVHCNADVVELVSDGALLRSARLRDGSGIDCAAVILAVPHFRLATLLPSAVLHHSVTPEFLAAPSIPIVSIHLWFEKDFMPNDVVGLIGRRVQWIFNKRKINSAAGKGGDISCVISAANDIVDMENDDVVRMAMDDLRSVYENAPLAPTHSLVIREKRATFSCTPEFEMLRPNHRTSIPNLFLAGDWTNTGLPATIEGAIISGERCAQYAALLLQETRKR